MKIFLSFFNSIISAFVINPKIAKIPNLTGSFFTSVSMIAAFFYFLSSNDLKYIY